MSVHPLGDMSAPGAFRHATHARYTSGCRCEQCRAAHSAYAKFRNAMQRAGDWNGLVPADAARQHLTALASMGYGRRRLQAFTGISDTVICDIRRGLKTHIRARTAKMILAARPDVPVERHLSKTYEQARRVEFCRPCLKSGHLCVAVTKVGDEPWCSGCACPDELSPLSSRCSYFLGTGRYSPLVQQQIAAYKQQLRAVPLESVLVQGGAA